MLRVAYRWWSVLVLGLVVFQIGLAGYGAFYTANKLEGEGAVVDEDTFMDGFGLHADFGYLVILSGLILLAIGLAAGVGRWRLGRQGVLFLLLFVQLWLAWIGYEAPVVGFFHPVNAVAIFVLASWIVWDEFRGRRAAVSPAT